MEFTYRFDWQTTIYADTPEEAWDKALDLMRKLERLDSDGTSIDEEESMDEPSLEWTDTDGNRQVQTLSQSTKVNELLAKFLARLWAK